MEERIEGLWRAVEAEVSHGVGLRHELHRIPETGFREVKTASVVARELAALGLTVTTGVGGTGVTADLETGREGPFVVLRAEMDGLPVEEKSALPYRSVHDGASHCCGHDGHMATLLATARALCRLTDTLRGGLRFLFQPSEETAEGAQRMIEAGALGPGRPTAILCLHGLPGLDTDTVACRRGVMMASTDAFRIDVTGRGGHSSRPELARNPLIGMARIVEALSNLRLEDRVVTVCELKAGTRANVIPDDGTLTGTCRGLRPEARQATIDQVAGIADAICREIGLEGKTSVFAGCPPVVTDDGLFDLFTEVGRDLEGLVRVVDPGGPSLGAEDFAYYLDHAPGLLFRLGIGKDSPWLHTSNFDFNDDALRTGMLVLVGMAVNICSR